MSDPKTWDEAAKRVSQYISPWTDSLDRSIAHPNSDIYFLRRIFAGEGVDQTRAHAYALSMAGAALGELTGIGTHPSPRATLDEILALIARKQHDYGSGNILAFGEKGIIVRLSDKVERYKNLKARGTEDGATGESLRDTLVDIIGYAIVLRMLHDGTFELPLAADLKTKDADRTDVGGATIGDVKRIVREELKAYHEARSQAPAGSQMDLDAGRWLRYAKGAIGGDFNSVTA